MTTHSKPDTDEAWVDSVEVMTEYERGRQDGVKQMQGLADQVMKQAVADELEIEALKARVEALKAKQSIPAQGKPIAWRVIAGGGSERHLYENKRDAQAMFTELTENGWEDAVCLPLYAGPSVPPQSNDIAHMPEGVSETANLRTASEIEAERLARKTASLPPHDDSDDEQEPKGWRCFHCSEFFTDINEAAHHFGPELSSTPACKLSPSLTGLIRLIRDHEDELRRFRSEETASFREFYALGADHRQALIREEQKGYDRGLADGRGEANHSQEAAAPHDSASPQSRSDELKRLDAIGFDELAETLAENVHTAFRKGCENGDKVWRALRDMPSDDFAAAFDWMIWAFRVNTDRELNAATTPSQEVTEPKP